MDNKNYDGIKWSKTKDGYWVNGKHGYQHRYVYEKLTGLKVFDYQVVHHLDGDKSNNTAENLVCMTKSDHSYLHSILDKTGIRVGKTNKGKTSPMKDKQHTEEAKKKMSELNKGENNPMFGKYQSEEVKRKISESKSGKHHKLVICPYCKKEGGINNMHRWHFDNCRNKGA